MWLGNFLDALEEAYEAFSDELQKAQDEIKAVRARPTTGNCPPNVCLKKKAEEAITEIVKIQERTSDLEMKRGNVRSKLEEMKASTKTLESARLSLKAKQAQLSDHKVTDKPEPPAPPTADITSLREKANILFVRIQELGATNERLRLYNERLSKRETHEADLKKAENAQRYLDALKESLGPSGVKQEVMASKVSAFLEEVNAGLKGIAPPLHINQAAWEWSGLIRGKAVPYDALSDGQKIRLSLVFQTVLAKRSGINIVCFKANDVERPLLAECIAYLQAAGVQAFIEVVEDTPHHIVEGVAHFWVHGGKITELVAKEVAGV